MTRNDWYRRSSWTPKDQADFFARLKRSRGPDSKAQYLTIQAEHLMKAGLHKDAWPLLETVLCDYPAYVYRARTFEAAGECLYALARVEEAITYLRHAMHRQREFPGIQTNACFTLGRLAVEKNRADLFDEVLAALNDFGHPVLPWHTFMDCGIRACILSRRGQATEARVLAQRALAAAEATHSGMRYHPHVGLVTKDRTPFYDALVWLTT